MRQAIDDEHVRELSTQHVVGLSDFTFRRLGKDFGFLHRVGGEESCVITILAHGQRDEAFAGELKFAPVGYQDFSRYLGLQLPQRLVEMDRQVTHGAAGLRTDDVRAPAILGKAISDATG
ncbi:hypothetical protein D3C81_1613910 [compost metagenome]